ncbi:MAG: OmpA family protein [Endomicrobium sp.]|jgi:outer membrane protein OmpA-like peptidoglycan-associated protein|nr:OmpA family protein [Endomicrobium sp.]
MIRNSAFIFICLSLVFFAGSAGAERRQANPTLKQIVKNEGYKVTIYFDVSSSQLNIDSRDAIMRVAKLQAVSDTKAFLSGYSDKTGAYEKNLILSQMRVNAVKDFLIGLGIKEENIHAEFFGANDSADSSDTPEGYAKNRRVEIVLLAKDAAQETAENSAAENSVSAETQTEIQPEASCI